MTLFDNWLQSSFVADIRTCLLWHLLLSFAAFSVTCLKFCKEEMRRVSEGPV